jgi:glycosyltransferase involved in cell wall biosynthesis
MAMISVTILTKNCGSTLKKTLESLKLFPEIVIGDTGSTDDTLEVAKNCRIVSLDFQGFGPTHNQASLMATHDWILSVDSDEIVTPELAHEILNLKLDATCVYAIRRKNYFNNKHIKGCAGWDPDWVIRLYHKGRTRFSNDQVHEKIITEGLQLVHLRSPLIHTPYRTSADLITKMQTYSTLFAEQNKGRKKSSLSRALFHGFFAFFKSYILKTGFRAGREGFIISLSQGQTAYYKYLKLAELNKIL